MDSVIPIYYGLVAISISLIGFIGWIQSIKYKLQYDVESRDHHKLYMVKYVMIPTEIFEDDEPEQPTITEDSNSDESSADSGNSDESNQSTQSNQSSDSVSTVPDDVFSPEVSADGVVRFTIIYSRPSELVKKLNRYITPDDEHVFQLISLTEVVGRRFIV